MASSPSDFNNQTVIVPGTEDDQRIRINARLITPDNQCGPFNQDTYLNFLKFSGNEDDPLPTVYDLFMNSVNNKPNNPFLGHINDQNQVEYKTYAECRQIVDKIGSVLISQLNVPRNNPNYNIGMYAGNCYNWDLTALAANCYNFSMVPMYETLGDQAMEFIINQSEMDVLMIDTAAKIEKYFSLLNNGNCRKIQHLVYFEENSINENVQNLASQHGINLHHLQALIDQTEEILPHAPPKLDDIFCICYTSGTTG